MSAGKWLSHVLAAVPAKPTILRWAARMPPEWRTALSFRLIAAVARRTTDEAGVLDTNMGIDRRLVCSIPSGHYLALFGLPRFYVGERATLALAARFGEQADAIVDIGAHVGYFTFYLATHQGRRCPVYFVEPDEELFDGIKANVARNRLSDVRGIQAAIARVDGHRRFRRNLDDTTSGSLTDDFARTHETLDVDVEARSFSSLADALGFRQACVKVDVEGAEWEFLEGGAPAFDRISSLLIEILGPAYRAGLVQALAARGGWQAYYINDFSLEHSLDGEFEYREPQYNWLFCRQRPADLAALVGSQFTVRGGSGAHA